MDPRAVVEKLQVTEKGTALQADQGKYLFRVCPDANKIQIKAAVEAMFGVKVVGVNTMRYEGKRKRERTIRYGKRSDWKRAVVTLAQGEKIDIV
jgi:large subunit ribosomal protein L23